MLMPLPPPTFQSGDPTVKQAGAMKEVKTAPHAGQADWMLRDNDQVRPVLTEQQIQQTLRMMSLPPDSRLTPEIARDLIGASRRRRFLAYSVSRLCTGESVSGRAPGYRSRG